MKRDGRHNDRLEAVSHLTDMPLLSARPEESSLRGNWLILFLAGINRLDS